MKKLYFILAITLCFNSFSQKVDCRTTEAMKWLYENDTKAKLQNDEFEKFTQNYIQTAQKSNTTGCYVIPVVFHVYGTTQSGKPINNSVINFALAAMNLDFHGLNSDFNSVHQLFQSSKGSMPDVTFALALLDPNGNTTTGVVYHPVAAGFGNSSGYDTQIAADAWDNFKYMNIYIQNDLYDDAVFTNSGIAWYPNTTMSNNKTARIVYNGAYLGANTSTEFASVLTHEYGHWLNLLHTFSGGCTMPNDNVADTPECDYSSLNYTCHATPTDTYPANCNSITVNAENYMDYSGAYGCYKMFSIGQVARMYTALQHPSRISLWQPSNLVATGLSQLCSSTGIITLSSNQFNVNVYPNTAGDLLTILSSEVSVETNYTITDQLGRTVLYGKLNSTHQNINVTHLVPAIYYFNVQEKGKLLASRKIIKH
ncbi:MAG: zinc-dependent metalloprotease [Bacteroidota bacterium]|nr:zinc-dependent metalloprotease [Bacteroidota bacterium]